jgi:hypothetical protein
MVKILGLMGLSTEGGKCFVLDGGKVGVRDLNQKMFFAN